MSTVFVNFYLYLAQTYGYVCIFSQKSFIFFFLDYIFFLEDYFFINYFNYNFYGLYPEIYVIFFVIYLVLLLSFIDFFFLLKVNSLRLSYFSSLIINFWLFFIVLYNINSFYFYYNNFFLVNYFSNFLKLFLVVVFFFCLFISYDYLVLEKIYNYELYILLFLAILGLFNLCSSNNLLLMYLSIELQTLAFYILSCYKQYSNFSSEASLKYFILGAFSSGLILFGISIVYGFTGLLNLKDIYLLILVDSVSNFYVFVWFLLGVFFIILGIFFKLGVAPFHMWIPDIYEGIPTIFTLVFSVLPKIVMLFLLIKFYFCLFFKFGLFWNLVSIFFIFLSLLVGSFGAMYQVKLKRLLAYSAISHMGYLLSLLLVVNIDNFYSLFFYIFVYIVISLNLFCFLIFLRKRYCNIKIKSLYELIFLCNSNYVLSFLVCLILFSLIGLPPLLGFYSKFFVFLSLINLDYYFLVFFISIISVISSIYYIRLIKLIFFKIYTNYFFIYDVSKICSLLISYIFLINVYFIFSPTILIHAVWIISINLNI